MPTLRQIIFNFRNPASGGKSTRDRGLSDRQIAYIAQICRAKLIGEFVVKTTTQESPVQFEQDLGCVTLTDADAADCASINWNGQIKKVKIPPILDLPQNGGLTFFGLIDKRTRIYLPDMQYGDLDDHVPFKKKNNIKAFMVGDWIYVYGVGSENLGVVNIRGIFSEPTLVQTFGATGFTPRCFDWDADNYPISPVLEQDLYDMMNAKYLNILASAPEDIKNDELKQTIV